MSLTRLSLTRRRLLALSALAAPLLALPGAAAAFDFQWGRDSDGDAPAMQPPETGGLDYMPLVLAGNAAFTARSALVVTDAAAYYGAFTGRVWTRDENKIGIVKDIPLVGDLFTERLRAKDFDPAHQIGVVFQMGNVLVVDLHLTRVTLDVLATRLLAGGEGPAPSLKVPDLEGKQSAVKSLVAANQSVSYHVPGTILAPVDPKSPPDALRTLATPGAAKQVGQAYRYAEGHLLTLVRPSILTGWS